MPRSVSRFLLMPMGIIAVVRPVFLMELLRSVRPLEIMAFARRPKHDHERQQRQETFHRAAT